MNRKKSKRILQCTVLSFLILMMAYGHHTNAEQSEKNSCELALYRCLNDPLYYGTGDGVFHCLLGYIFCKKYIE